MVSGLDYAADMNRMFLFIMNIHVKDVSIFRY